MRAIGDTCAQLAKHPFSNTPDSEDTHGKRENPMYGRRDQCISAQRTPFRDFQAIIYAFVVLPARLLIAAVTRDNEVVECPI